MDAVNAQVWASRDRGVRPPPSFLPRIGLLIVAASCAACATRPPPDIEGRWQAVNRYDAAPVAMPLVRPYVFHASPVDRSLRAMLLRWAADANRTLVYAHPSDFSLYGPVADIGTTSLEQAAAALTDLYARQRVVVSVDADSIRVVQADRGAVAPATSAPSPSAVPR